MCFKLTKQTTNWVQLGIEAKQCLWVAHYNNFPSAASDPRVPGVDRWWATGFSGTGGSADSAGSVGHDGSAGSVESSGVEQDTVLCLLYTLSNFAIYQQLYIWSLRILNFNPTESF